VPRRHLSVDFRHAGKLSEFLEQVGVSRTRIPEGFNDLEISTRGRVPTVDRMSLIHRFDGCTLGNDSVG
jgi:hypothetical protein